jgi:hypothetical protein
MGIAVNGAPRTAQVAVTSTAARLVAVPSGAGANVGRAGSGIVIKALAANSAAVFIGDEDVTTANGYGLAAGDSVSLNIDDPSKIWCVCAATQTLHIIYV